jgi:hypothetical protein
MITLVLRLGTRVIGSVPVDENKFSDREYIAGRILELHEKFAEQLAAFYKPPVIYLEGVPSKMNRAIETQAFRR